MRNILVKGGIGDVLLVENVDALETEEVGHVTVIGGGGVAHELF